MIPERSDELKTRLYICVIAQSGGSGQYWQNSAGDLSVKNYVTVMLQMSSLPSNKGRGENKYLDHCMKQFMERRLLKFCIRRGAAEWIP